MISHLVFPWCQAIWKNLISTHQKNRLPHAILFFGNSGLGKSELAQQFAQYLLCSDPKKDSSPCDTCKDCILFLAKTHGDFYYFSSENNKAIGIEQIREITSEAYKKPQRNGVKVFIITDADKMSIAASNALLKTLEEPPGDSIFILTSERKRFLSPTILSRCQHFSFKIPDLKETREWLSASGEQVFSTQDITTAMIWSLGAPLLARDILENNLATEYQSYITLLLAFFSGQESLVALSKAWNGKSLTTIIYAIQITCYYLLKGTWRVNFNRAAVYQWSRKTIEIKKQLSTNIAINETLMLDLLFSS